jgi:chromosome segregation ATPase
MIEEFEKIKKEIEQLRIKNEELNARILKAIEDGKKLTEEDKYKLPEPKYRDVYYTFALGEDKGWESYHFTSNFDQNQFKRFAYFLNEDVAKKRLKQVENYLKVMHYLEAVNEGWIPDWSNTEQRKRFISIVEEDIASYVTWSNYRILSFKSQEALDNFKKFVSNDEIKAFFNPLGVK